MKTLSILICSLLLTACGLRTVEKKSVNIHPELQAYANQFEQKGMLNIDNLNMTFGEVDGRWGVLGFCQSGVKEVYVKGGLEKHVYNIRNVVIDIKDWNSMGVADREQLVFHELGHCVLNRGHWEQWLVGRPASIMYPEHDIGNTYYTGYYGSYLQELFKKPVLVSSFNASAYTNGGVYTSIAATEFVEPEITIPHESELKGGCVHELEPEVIHEDETESEPESTENI